MMCLKLKNIVLLLCLMGASTLHAGTSYVELLDNDTELIGQKVGPDLLGKHSFDPHSAEYAARVMLIREMSASLDNFPKIPFKELKKVNDITADLTDMSVQGALNGGILEAKWQGRKVIAKIEHNQTDPNYFVAENFSLLVINQLGLGPEYLGWTKTPWGRAMVMEKIEGVPLRGDYKEKHQYINRQTMEDLVDIFIRLIKAGIYPVDYQLMVDQKGRLHLLDVGNFKIWLAYRPEFEESRFRSGLRKLIRPTWRDAWTYLFDKSKALLKDCDPEVLNMFNEVYAQRMKLRVSSFKERPGSPLDGLSFESRQRFRESFRHLHRL